MFQFLLGLVVGGVLVWFFMRKGSFSTGSKDIVLNPNQEVIEKKRENLEKVLQMARERGEIANDDVEHALKVSDSTAERYLEELVEIGKLQRVGSRGKYVIYKLI